MREEPKRRINRAVYLHLRGVWNVMRHPVMSCSGGIENTSIRVTLVLLHQLQKINFQVFKQVLYTQIGL